MISRTITAIAHLSPHGVSMYDIKKLGKTIDKYLHLSDEREFENFAKLCREQFLTSTTEEVVAQPSDHVDAVPSTSSQAKPPPSQQASPMKRTSRKGPLAPRRQRFKKRLDFVVKSKVAMQQAHLLKLESLRAKLQRNNINRLSQVVRRKQATNEQLRRKLRSADMHKRIVAFQKELAVMQRKHRRLRLYHKGKTPVTLTTLDELLTLRTDVKAQNITIRHLENENLMMGETIESLQASGSPSLQKEGNTFSPEIRMLVYDAIASHVPTKHVPILMQKYANRFGAKMDTVPHRSTVEMMPANWEWCPIYKLRRCWCTPQTSC